MNLSGASNMIIDGNGSTLEIQGVSTLQGYASFTNCSNSTLSRTDCGTVENGSPDRKNKKMSFLFVW